MRTIKQPIDHTRPLIDFDKTFSPEDLTPEIRELWNNLKASEERMEAHQRRVAMKKRREEDEVLAHADAIIMKYRKTL